ncbi:fic family toxin-antitoxin system, toxin component [Streptomyces sp. CWNU-52B]|uniref:fic family toxin-antitoxin system, toxin component n=1 Tax=unclassified Streptomyces TaxID=2593676 RepID=UPI0039BFEEB7
MTQPDPQQSVPLELQFLLHAAELLDGDPQFDDYGPLYAAVGRVNAYAMGRDIYGSAFLRAGALLQTLVRLPSLEHSNEAFAWHCCEAYLVLNGHRVTYEPKDAVALVRDAAAGTAGVAQVARLLRSWAGG